MSQDAFSRLIQVSKGSLGFYERDENLPNSDVILKICSVSGVGIEWLLTGREKSGQEENGNIPAPPPSQYAPPQGGCPRCEKLENKLEKVENQRDELAEENRRLWKENAALREENATLRERQRKAEQARLFDERKDFRRNDVPLQRSVPGTEYGS